MAIILELAPVLTEADNPEFPIVQGIWNSSTQAHTLAVARRHHYRRPTPGGMPRTDLRCALTGVDAIVLAPTVISATGAQYPADGAVSARLIGHRLVDLIAAEHPDLPIVLVSDFVVGQGIGRTNARSSTRGLRALEAHLRVGPNTWTILRPTGFSPVHDESYQVRLTDDQHADGQVSRESLADAVITAIEHPDAAGGRTATVFSVSCPRAARIDLADRFRALAPDWEASLDHRVHRYAEPEAEPVGVPTPGR